MTKYAEYKKIRTKANDLSKVISVLHWDQETQMPQGGAALRAQQISTLSGILHEHNTKDSYGKLLEELNNEASLDAKQKRNVELSRKRFQKNTKFDLDLIIEYSKTSSECFQAWQKAKKEDDFAIFEPHLTKMVSIKRRQAELLGFEDHPYTALMDEYEPDMTTKEVEVLFDEVRDKLTPFIKKVFDAPQVNDSWISQHYDHDKQWNWGMDLLKFCKYDLKHGRQDISTHPFTTDFGAHDVRLTTRINDKDFMEMSWSTLHECGHALYEQGLPIEEYGLPSGTSVSLGIHESQSRLYENNLGRSYDFWTYCYPKLQQLFPENLADISLDEFYKSINKVAPSLIRTSADELTYHSHIMIRFEIEKALIEGSLEVKDLPSAWNQKYKDYLNVDVPSDAMGCMQDVHWSHGSFGYFPTYSLGSFYAAQFYHKLSKDINNYTDLVRNGDYQPLLDWLRCNIHQHGSTYKASELCEKATGESLNFDYFLKYAKEKFGAIYGV